MQNKLILTVGLPRSGKSTWAQQSPHPIVSPDAVRLAMHGQAFVKEAEELVWAMTKIMVRSLFLAGCETVILDATNINRKRREIWKSDLWDREYVEFTTSSEECIQRARDGGREDLIPIIEGMAERQEPIEDDERD